MRITSRVIRIPAFRKISGLLCYEYTVCEKLYDSHQGVVILSKINFKDDRKEISFCIYLQIGFCVKFCGPVVGQYITKFCRIKGRKNVIEDAIFYVFSIISPLKVRKSYELFAWVTGLKIPCSFWA